MTSEPNALPRPAGATQPFYWSVQRELWEYRSIYVAPVIVGAVIVFGFLLSAMAGIWEKALRLDATQPFAKLAEPYDLAALLIMGTTFVVAIFYCLEALHGERRDRSILFWKSLPVSDFTTVLSKASIPLLVLPLVTFVVTVATQWLMLMISIAVLLMQGSGAGTLWTQLPLAHMWVMVLYHLLAIHSLWYAPIFGYLLMVSAWARRAAFLWAFLPLLAIGIIEKIGFRSTHFGGWLGSRIAGATGATPGGDGVLSPMTHLSPGRFLVNPGLWLGLILCAGFLAAAVRLRRYQGPI